MISEATPWDTKPVRFTKRINFWSSASIACATFNIVSTALTENGCAKIGLAVAGLSTVFALRTGLAKATLIMNAHAQTSQQTRLELLSNEIFQRANISDPPRVLVTKIPDPHNIPSVVQVFTSSVPFLGGGKMYDHGAALTNSFISPYKTQTIIFGEKSLEDLSDKQAKAIIAHETGHFLTEDLKPSLRRTSKAGSSLSLFLLLSSTIGYDALTLELFAGWIANSFLNARANQAVEFRADYNSIMIQNDPTAYQQAIEHIASGFGVPFDPEKFSIMSIVSDIWSSHPSLQRRITSFQHYSFRSPEFNA